MTESSNKLVQEGWVWFIAPMMSVSTATVWSAPLQIGTWTNGGAGLLAALLGSSSKLMPTLNEKFPPPNGMDHPMVTNTLLICGVTVLLALFITLYGLLQARVDEKALGKGS